MKTKIAFFCAALLCTSPLQAQEIQENPLLCGFLMYDENGTSPGIVNVKLDEPVSLSSLHESSLNISGGTFSGNTLYLQTYDMGGIPFRSFPTALYAKNTLTGEETLIAEYTQDDPIFNDMTHDPVSGKFYAIGATEGMVTSNFYELDMETGEYLELFPLDYNFVAVAANDDGEIYGIDETGWIHIFHLEEGYTDFRIETGETSPMYAQSMAFEPGTNLLYWAGCRNNSLCFLSVIDMDSEEVTSLADPIPGNANIGALFFTGQTQTAIPVPPADFTAVPDPEGGLSVSLSWTNPDTSMDGSPLTRLDSIKIYRNDTLIGHVGDPVPGQTGSYVDNTVRNGLATYRITASNQEGESASSGSQVVFVGVDHPGLVENLELVRQDGFRASLRWDKPSTGMHQGYFDTNGIVYHIIRFPDHLSVARNLDRKEFTDTTLLQTYGYSYGVVASNQDGTGDTAVSNKVIIGPALPLPLTNNFSTEAARSLVDIVDADQDSATWKFGSNYAGTSDWYIEYPWTEGLEGEVDDWFFMAPVHLEAGRQYLLNYDVRMGGSLGQTHMRIALCDSNAPEAVVQQIDEKTDLQSNFVFETAGTPFVPETTGDYWIGFQCYYNTYFMQITHVNLQETVDTDVSCLTIQGLEVAVRGQETTLDVEIQNTGATLVEELVVQVVDNKGTVVGETNVRQDSILPLNRVLTVGVDCIIETEEDETELYAVTRTSGDGRSGNDTTARPLAVEVLSEEEYTLATVGERRNNAHLSAFIPFDLHVRYGTAQMLYTQEMLGFPAATIDRLGFYYFVTRGEYAKDVDMKIYMANTEETSLGTAWIPETEFSLVYEGSLNLDSANFAQILVLDESFRYEGNSLVIMTQTDGGKEEFFYNWFLASTPAMDDPGTYSLSYNSDDTPFDYTQEGMESPQYANLAFILRDLAPSGNQEAQPERRKTFRLVSMKDGVRIIAEEEMDITVHNLLGQCVIQSKHIGAGSTTLPLPSGLYLINGQKAVSL